MRDTGEISAILFDKDCTLIDFNTTWFGIISALANGTAPDPRTARLLVEQGSYD